MPELPEVETTKKSLEPFLDKKVQSVQSFRKNLRWDIAENLDTLIGSTLSKLERRAKYLILTFTKEASKGSYEESFEKKLIVHLGMSGSFNQPKIGTEKLKHDHVIFDFDGVDVSLNYNDPRRFGAILWHDEYADKLMNHLAPEPLDDAFNAEYLYKKLQKSKRAIKTSVMDQEYVVGVGNIYASESLFMSGIHPQTPSNKVTKKKLALLVDNIKIILQRAINVGGSTLNDFTYGEAKTGYFQQTLLVYGREGEPCTTCKHPIENIKISGRASCFCPKCQKL